MLKKYGGWKELICGFHIGGFSKERPLLYHVPCQLEEEGEDPHEPKLYRDFPDKRGLYLTIKAAIPVDCCFPSAEDLHESIEDTSSAGSSYQKTYFPHTEGSYSGSLPESFRNPDNPIERAYESLEENGYFHLRNGSIDFLISQFDNLYGRTPEEVEMNGNKCLSRDLKGWYVFYKETIGTVCDMYSHFEPCRPTYCRQTYIRLLF